MLHYESQYLRDSLINVPVPSFKVEGISHWVTWPGESPKIVLRLFERFVFIVFSEPCFSNGGLWSLRGSWASFQVCVESTGFLFLETSKCLRAAQTTPVMNSDGLYFQASLENLTFAWHPEGYNSIYIYSKKNSNNNWSYSFSNKRKLPRQHRGPAT